MAVAKSKASSAIFSVSNWKKEITLGPWKANIHLRLSLKVIEKIIHTQKT